ncbi:hypothetical protein IAQ61_003615 [Plenodomus lingam]|uniref:uncharacterized protein n=1 Tax=Leptosphaeria maculans TaxID=5022 RepID=UPI00332AF13E|nr:hypothetical protein IAQ61_003615 [Plenodomus lingam]
MGRGGYDTTDAAAYKSSAAADVIREHNAQRARAEAEAAEEMRRDELAKLIRSKKSRGIRDAQKVAKAKTKEGGEKDGSGGTGEGSAA